MEKTDMTNSRYWVEFIDHDGIQQSIYLYGQSVEQIKVIIDEYEIVVIDNTETYEETYWGREQTQAGSQEPGGNKFPLFGDSSPRLGAATREVCWRTKDKEQMFEEQKDQIVRVRDYLLRPDVDSWDMTLWKAFHYHDNRDEIDPDQFNGDAKTLNNTFLYGAKLYVEKPEKFKVWGEGFIAGCGWSIQTLAERVTTKWDKEEEYENETA